MKVLITGSRGFVGTALKQRLTEAGISFDTVMRQERADQLVPRISRMTQSGGWHVAWPDGLSEIPFAEYSCVIHLAFPVSVSEMSMEQVIEAHTSPIRAIINGIQRSGSTCLFVYLSSQSATKDAVSKYGRGKWEAEQALRSSGISWTVVKPGLIVGPSSKGLFAGILKIAKHSPVIGVPSGRSLTVQPVLLRDVVAACVHIARAPDLHKGRSFDLALPPRPLPDMVREACSLLGLNRLIMPIPWRIIASLLSVSEALSIPLPASRDSLFGLLGSQELSSIESEGALGLTLRPLTKESLGRVEREGLEAEGHFLFVSLFGIEPSPEVLDKYAASQTSRLLNGAWIDVDTIIARRLNVEAVEFATRRRGTILSQKVLILSYIAELCPEYTSFFINNRSSRVKAFLTLAAAGIRAAWSLAYGSYLVWRFRLLKRAKHD